MQLIRLYLIKLLRMDKLSLLVMFFLLGTGMVFIRSAGMDYGGAPAGRWLAQIAWIVIGCGMFFACSLTDYHMLGRYSWMLFVLGLMMLSLVFISGGKDDGARSILHIAGIQIQVSEPVKAVSLLFISYALSNSLLQYSKVPPFLVWLVLALLPFGLVFLQGDGGTALVFLPFSFAILFVNGLKWRWIALMTAAVIIVTPLAFKALKPYQKLRILVFMQSPCENIIDAAGAFVEPETQQKWKLMLSEFTNDLTTRSENSEEQTDNKPHKKIKWDDWNARQVQMAVGSGGITGLGYMQGKQHTLGFLTRSVAPTDFIFAVICEEAGFIGALGVLSAFTLLIIFSCVTAVRANDTFGASIAVGGAVIFATHVFINVGMCVGWAPIIGIPLPFVSYGGSCMIGMMLISGLIQSVHIHTSRNKRNELNAEPDTESETAI